jgi:TetR/AcrR family transcriptional repressor of nem operon
MPWDKEHKQRTRQRILEAAAAAFRARGINGVGLADVMQTAGLTHGGFYAHFKSKDDLIAATLAFINESRLARFDEMIPVTQHGSALATMADVYLSTRHREHPETGCAIATLGCELAREDGRARRQLSRNVAAWLEKTSDRAPGSDAKAKLRNGTGMFATMVGGLILARVADDPHESDRILTDIRAFLKDALDHERDG